MLVSRATFASDPADYRWSISQAARGTVSTLETVEKAIRDSSSDIIFCGSTDQWH
jgi:hypothetical protein